MDEKRLKRFKFWCQMVIPLVYDDSLSYYEVLCKVVDYLNNLASNQNEMSDYLKQLDAEFDEVKEDLNFIMAEIEKIKNGEYTSMYINSLIAWIDKNIQCLVARIVKYVCFGLDDKGNFVAYIPDTWDFLTFGTITDPDNKLYGHLTLNW